MSVTCPDCGGPVSYDLDCHTFRQGGRWMACMPCDSAIRYICRSAIDDETSNACRWGYTDGLNPGNPRAAENQTRRPAWLEGHEVQGQHGVRALPGVPMLGDEDE